MIVDHSMLLAPYIYSLLVFYLSVSFVDFTLGYMGF